MPESAGAGSDPAGPPPQVFTPRAPGDGRCPVRAFGILNADYWTNPELHATFRRPCATGKVT